MDTLRPSRDNRGETHTSRPPPEGPPQKPGGVPETLKVLSVRSRRCPTCQTLAPNTPFCPASFAAGKVGPRTDLKDQQAGAQAVSRSELRAAQGGEGAGCGQETGGNMPCVQRPLGHRALPTGREPAGSGLRSPGARFRPEEPSAQRVRYQQGYCSHLAFKEQSPDRAKGNKDSTQPKDWTERHDLPVSAPAL